MKFKTKFLINNRLLINEATDDDLELKRQKQRQNRSSSRYADEDELENAERARIDDLFKTDTSPKDVAAQQPKTKSKSDSQSQSNRPGPRVSSRRRPVNVNIDMTNAPNMNFADMEPDEISDDEALARSGRQPGNAARNRYRTVGATPEPTQPNTLPAIPVTDLATLSRSLEQQTGVHPDWFTVADTPGYLGNAIRQIGRTVFKTFTKTSIEDISMLANLQGQGNPNDQRELDAVANWARNHAQRNKHAETEMTAEFGDRIPGYSAQLRVYITQEDTFVVVKDFAGQYIYSWPTKDNKDAFKTDDQLGHDGGSNNLRLENNSFIGFLITEKKDEARKPVDRRKQGRVNQRVNGSKEKQARKQQEFLNKKRGVTESTNSKPATLKKKARFHKK